MCIFVLYAKDKLEGGDLRTANRDAHLAHMARLDASGCLLFAGPLKNSDTSKSIGSLIIFEAETLENAKALMASDPYMRAGVFEWSEVLPTLKAFPKASEPSS